MGRKGAKTNQVESQNCNSIKTNMVQDKADQKIEQIAGNRIENTNKNLEIITSSPEDQRNKSLESGEEVSRLKDQQQKMAGDKDVDSLQALPTKQDMAEMMSHLEGMIKGELKATRRDIQNVLQRVEESEAHLNEHKKAILDLRARAESDWLEMRNIRYRLEDQENRSRRNNLRIRGLPESVKTSDLEKMLCEVFNKILDKEISSPIHFDRVHRIQKANMVPTDVARDVVARFTHYEIKQQVTYGMRSAAPIKFNGSEIIIFTEDLKDFCSKLDLPCINLEN